MLGSFIGSVINTEQISISQKEEPEHRNNQSALGIWKTFIQSAFGNPIEEKEEQKRDNGSADINADQKEEPEHSNNKSTFGNFWQTFIQSVINKKIEVLKNQGSS